MYNKTLSVEDLNTSSQEIEKLLNENKKNLDLQKDKNLSNETLLKDYDAKIDSLKKQLKSKQIELEEAKNKGITIEDKENVNYVPVPVKQKKINFILLILIIILSLGFASTTVYKFTEVINIRQQKNFYEEKFSDVYNFIKDTDNSYFHKYAENYYQRTLSSGAVLSLFEDINYDGVKDKYVFDISYENYFSFRFKPYRVTEIDSIYRIKSIHLVKDKQNGEYYHVNYSEKISREDQIRLNQFITSILKEVDDIFIDKFGPVTHYCEELEK